MIKKILLFLCLFYCNHYSLLSQNYIHQLKGLEVDVLQKVVIDAKNNIISGGGFEDSSNYNGVILKSLGTSPNTNSKKTYDIFITKTTASGQMLWTKIFGGEHYNSLIGLKEENENIIFFAQFYNKFAIGTDTLRGIDDWDVGVVKLDKDGNKLWAKSIATKARIIPRYFTTDNAGNIYVTANCTDTFYIDGQPYFKEFMQSFFVKFDATGNLKWAKILSNNAPGEIVVPTSVKILKTGEIIMAGLASKGASFLDGKQILDNGSSRRFFILKMKEDNSIIWNKIGIGPSSASDITIGNNEDIYFAGLLQDSLVIDNQTFKSNDVSLYHDLIFGKISSDGAIKWVKQYGNTSRTDFSYGLKYRNNKIYFAGTYNPNYKFEDTVLNPAGRTDAYLAEFDTNADLTKIITTRGENSLCISTFQDFDFDNSGNLYIVGSLNFMVNLDNTLLTTAGSTDAFLWKVSNWTAPTNINESFTNNSSSSQIDLYPNPADGNINIRFSVAKPENLKFEITDISGRTMILKPQSVYQEGYYNEEFNISALKPGCYFVKVSSGNNTQSRKLIITK